MKIKGNNNIIVNSHNTNAGWVKKNRITIISILTAISLLIGIYTDVYDYVIKFLGSGESSLNYDHAKFGDDTKQAKGHKR